MAIGLDLSIGSGGDGGGSGGALATGILQLHRAEPLDTTLSNVADQADTLSPLQLSTTKILMGTSAGSSPQTVNIGETNRLGSALYSSTYVIYGDWMELRGNTGIQIPTNNLVVGTTLASARLHVRGDGTNPIARFEDNSGNLAMSLTGGGSISTMNLGTAVSFSVNTGTTSFSSTLGSTASNVGTIPVYSFNQGTDASSSGTSNYVNVRKTIAPGAGSANFRNFIVEYTINASGANSGTATGIYSRATETALNGMLHNLIDLGTTALGSLFSVTNVGAIKVATLANADAPNSSLYFSSDAGRLTWKDAGGTVNNLY